MIFTALDTVTVPVVAFPIACNLAAAMVLLLVFAENAPSSIVTATSESSVLIALKLVDIAVLFASYKLATESVTPPANAAEILVVAAIA